MCNCVVSEDSVYHLLKLLKKCFNFCIRSWLRRRRDLDDYYHAGKFGAKSCRRCDINWHPIIAKLFAFIFRIIATPSCS